MSGFASDWLDLREPADEAARSDRLAGQLRAALETRAGGADRSAGDGSSRTGSDAYPSDPGRPLVVTDLGGGTGANLRWLAPRLGGRQAWRVVDDDPLLLDALTDRVGRWARLRRIGIGPARRTEVPGRADGLRLRAEAWQATVALIAADLAADPPPVEPVAGSLVTASALLDLVSSAWLDRLAGGIAAVGAAAFFALTYDGRIELDPADPRDADLRELVNAHQRRDKGFGPALGPTAVAAAEAALVGHGYRVETAASDWRLGADRPALSLALIEGWIAAAAEAEPSAGAWLGGWLTARRDQIAAGRLRLEVGHRDLLALPAGPAPEGAPTAR